MKCHICNVEMDCYRRRDEICNECRTQIKSRTEFEVTEPMRLINDDGVSFYVTWASKNSEAKLYVRCNATDTKTVEIIMKDAETKLQHELKSLRDELNRMIL